MHRPPQPRKGDKPHPYGLPPSKTLPREFGTENYLADYEPKMHTPKKNGKGWKPGNPLRIPPVRNLPTPVLWAARASLAIARRLVIAAVALLLVFTGFTGWELWGSNIYTKYQQERLNETLASAEPVVFEEPPAKSESKKKHADQPAPQFLIDTLSANDADAMGRITIPKIDVDEVFVYGTSLSELKHGPGLWKWGVMPGQPGNAMISGHRTTWSAPFRHIDSLKKGDEIRVEVPGQNDAVYAVRGTKIVKPDAVSVADQTDGVRLTLTACHPLGSAAERIVVQAELVEGDAKKYALDTDEWKFQK